MRTIKFLTVICFILSTISCTNDDMTPVDTNAQADVLVGTWNLTEESQDGKGTATIGGIPLTGNITSFAKDIDAQIIIGANPNNITASGGYTEVITGSFVNISRTEEIPVLLNGEISQGSWSLVDGVMTLSSGDETQKINIIELTSTRLKVEINVMRDVVIEDTDVAVDTTIEMIFTKQ